MDLALARYVRALRAAGAEISTAEAIDAARAVAIVGYSERTVLKDTLSVVLAKSEHEKSLHDRLFDLYFSQAEAAGQGRGGAGRPENKAGGQGDDESGEQTGDRQDQQQDESTSGQQPSGAPGGGSGRSSGGGGASPGQARDGNEARDGDEDGDGDEERVSAKVDALLELAQSDDLDRIRREVARAATAVGVDDIRFESQTAYYVRRTLDRMGIEALEARMLERMRERTPQAQAEVQTLMDARSALQRHVRAYVDRRFELFGRSATEQFMNEVVIDRAIGRLDSRDLDRMKVVVARMARRLAIRHSRRRRVRNQGQLDIRRTLRINAGHGGVPVTLVWKHRRKDRPRIVAVCDVSGSVAPYVRFLLLFLYALNEKVADLRAFAFSSRLSEVSNDLGGRDFDRSMLRILDRIGGGSTDYGQALADLEADHWDAIDGRTTVLILGDGRSNNSDPRLDLFREAADRAKRVVWLCPEPPGRWGTGDSAILKYRPFCTHLSHCATAADIERAIDEMLQAYD